MTKAQFFAESKQKAVLSSCKSLIFVVGWPSSQSLSAAAEAGPVTVLSSTTVLGRFDLRSLGSFLFFIW